MMRRFWHRKWRIRSRYQPLAAIRILLVVGLGMILLGQCLTQALQAAPLMPVGMGCDDDCWYQYKPSWHPVVLLQHVPGLSAPRLTLRFFMPASRACPGCENHQRALPPRAPPLALHGSRFFHTAT